MDEELSRLAHDFYNELGRVSDDKNDYEMWLKSTEFALQKMMVDNLDEIRKELWDISDAIINMSNNM